VQAVAAGFELVWFHDRTREILSDLRESRLLLEENDPVPLGLQSLLGERSRDRQINVARSTEEGRLTFMEAVLRKPPVGALVQPISPSVIDARVMTSLRETNAAEWPTRVRPIGRPRRGPLRPPWRPFRRGGPTRPA
jgi:hypothetical protein